MPSPVAPLVDGRTSFDAAGKIFQYTPPSLTPSSPIPVNPMVTGRIVTDKNGVVFEYRPPNLVQISSVLVPTSWNASDLTNITLSNNNLTATANTSTSNGVRAASGFSSGKYYFEETLATSTYGGTGAGLAGAGVALGTLYNAPAGAVGLYQNGNVYINGSNSISFGAPLASGTVIGIAVDLGANLIWLRVNNSNWNNSGTANPATATGGLNIASIAGTLLPFFSAQLLNERGIANFGGSAFNGVVPTGFTAGWGTLQ